MPHDDRPNLAPAVLIQRGIVSLVRRGPALAVTLVNALVISIVTWLVVTIVHDCGSRRIRYCPESKEDVARLTAWKYALEAYPTWLREHPGVRCPSLEQLNAYMNNKLAIDPWGTPYLHAYVTDAHGRMRLVVWSAGEDARFGSSDDIWSGS
jgi:hypothetical protein